MKSDLKALPYPVLGRSNDYIESSFQSTLDFVLKDSPEGDMVVANYAFLLSSDEIIGLIKNGTAAFAFDIKCTDTLYREVKHCSQYSGSIHFQPGQLYGKAIFAPIITVVRPIKAFTAADLNPEFQNLTVPLFPGDVIGVDDSISKYFEFNKLKFESLVRIETVLDLPTDNYSFHITSDILVIQMGKNFRSLWDFYSQEKDKAPFLAMSVYKDCIHAALEFISKNEEESENFKWARALKVKIATLGLGKELKVDSDFNTLDALAQQLISKIGVQRLLKNV